MCALSLSIFLSPTATKSARHQHPHLSGIWRNGFGGFMENKATFICLFDTFSPQFKEIPYLCTNFAVGKFQLYIIN